MDIIFSSLLTVFSPIRIMKEKKEYAILSNNIFKTFHMNSGKKKYPQSLWLFLEHSFQIFLFPYHFNETIWSQITKTQKLFAFHITKLYVDGFILSGILKFIFFFLEKAHLLLQQDRNFNR